jgi:3-deoxy-D-arabino-heptulosonate 7-phosphate (DAHP) synthase
VIDQHADVVQIGARNMQNYALLEVAGKLGKPVLLKRGCRRRWTSCCRPPTTSSRRATRT